MIYHGEYGFDDLPATVDATVAALRPHRDRFDSLAVIGMSGVVVGSPVSLALNVPLVIVRKVSDQCHGWNRIVGLDYIGRRYLVIDDFKATGRTLRYLRDQLTVRATEAGVDLHYAGVYYYGNRLGYEGRADGFRWPRGRPAKAAAGLAGGQAVTFAPLPEAA